MTTIKSLVLILLCTIFTSAGQLLWKAGVALFDFSAVLSFLNLPFILGCLSYGLGLILMLTAFRDGELSVLYPIVATSYVWVSVASPFFFADSMNGWKWAGVALIVGSVVLLSKGRKTEKRQEGKEPQPPELQRETLMNKEVSLS